MEENDILERINSFPRWHYQFDLRGHLTPIQNTRWANRHLERKKYFFDPLVEFLGGSLAGKRVLDLGCNAGFWSLLAIENDCEFVLGIDGRSMHIEQADFVFEVNQVEKHRYHFVKGNVFEVDFKEFGLFDIVFFLGLMYHINRPVELVEKIAQVNTDLLLIDTNLSMVSGAFLEVVHEDTDDPRRSVDYELVLRPTKQAVFDIVQQFGYDIRMLEPHFQDYTGAKDYQIGQRRAFLCAKKTDLTPLPVIRELASSRHRTSISVNTSTKDLRVQKKEPAGGTTEEGAKLKFNIVYTPGTVKYLQLFVFSLLKWLDCSFRLVANGCSRQEKHLLRTLCQDNSRLEFLALPTKSVLTHGEALSYLQSLEHSDTFCFMDSDILANGDFVSELVPHLGQFAGVFSGSPIIGTEQDRTLPAIYPWMQGRFNRTDTGVCLGSTYLAMYDNRVLKQARQSTGIGFEQRRWADIPIQYRGWLTETGLKKASYDAGKLLNLVLAAQGEQLVFVESSLLLHIGGISVRMVRDRNRQASFVRRVRWRVKRLMAFLGMKESQAQHAVIADAEAMRARWRERHDGASSYFIELLSSLLENRQQPEVPDMDDPEIEEGIRSVTANIIASYNEFAEQLVR